MMKRILQYIGGMPVSGKTTLMRRIREQLGEMTLEQHGLLRYEDYPNHVILGIYAGELFDGTDKLSMAVTSDAVTFLRDNKKTVLVEGDRLFTKKFLDSAKALNYKVVINILEVGDSAEIARRFAQRGAMQDIKFLKGRFTKIENIKHNFPHVVINSNNPVEWPKIEKIIGIN